MQSWIIFFLFTLAAVNASEPLPTRPILPLPQNAEAKPANGFPTASQWKAFPADKLRHEMGKGLRPLPRVKFRIAYDAEALYLRYDVTEYAVRAVAKRHGDMVCLDSCVEFFFSPSADLSAGYFNLEMNCGGTALLQYRPAKGRRIHDTTAREFQGAAIRTTLPRIVEPERKGPLHWTLEARIPFTLLQKIHRFPAPEPGTVWRGNFYKCADRTSRPHWLTWAKVHNPTPAFHIPKDFGKLTFE
ncbi:MAG: carbohydrate-binding family 9-like protein [Verrucomicrobia bacterium]|nr:carbohydrate-binding family 9-like protein [Verrucomicrobiota bacterium]